MRIGNRVCVNIYYIDYIVRVHQFLGKNVESFEQNEPSTKYTKWIIIRLAAITEIDDLWKPVTLKQ